MKIRILSILILFACSSQAQIRRMTMEDIWTKGTFNPQRVDGFQSARNGDFYFVQENHAIIAKHNLKTGEKVAELLNLNDFPDNQVDDIDSYAVNDAENKVIVATNTEAIYRRSYMADYYYYDLEKKTSKAVSPGRRVRLASISPCGTKVAFVRDNNLFYLDAESGREIQITTDGENNHIINGATDWVYEEEFAITKGFCWSLDSEKIVYMKFDESNVKEVFLTKWGELYPTLYRYKYPKAGEENSKVSLHIYDLKTNQTNAIPSLNFENEYFPKIMWTKSNDKFAFLRMNRLQNKMEMVIYDTDKKATDVVYQEESKTYIDVPDIYFTQDGRNFVIANETDGYNHLYLYSMKGEQLKKLTVGEFDVKRIYGLDEKTNTIYFQAALSSPANRDLYSVNVNEKNPKMVKLSTDLGTTEALFSQDYRYFIKTYSSANTVPVYTLCDNKGNLIKVLEDNKALADKYKEYDFVDKTFGTITLGNNINLPYWIMKPKNMEPGKAYPLLMFTYGGPGSQEVLNAYEKGSNTLWYQYLVKQGYIVACVDNRGTGSQGEAFKKVTYMQLGRYETEDQIAAAKYFGNLDYIDKTRIGIWGWSYGGYLSTLCLLKGSDVFKMAISVAPVSDWKHYDNIYTERFMRTPQENLSGYDQNSPVNFADLLKGKFLLVHSTADDNVLLEHSMDFITALNNAGKEYDFALYPNKNHSIIGAHTRMHLYKKMTTFILNNL